MRILMLILSSDTFPVYAQHREVWRTYMKRHPDVDCYFIQYSPATFTPILTTDTLTMRGRERYDTILTKTVDALSFFLPRAPYTHVVRTNLSSVWDFGELVAYLNSQPSQRFYGGIELKEGGASGAGILLSRDVAERLVRNRRALLSIGTVDDVDIGIFLRQVGIPLTISRRVDFLSLAQYEGGRERVPSGTFHYRVKHLYAEGRLEEPEVMRRILREQVYRSGSR
jgi:hypothetical protein